MIKEVVLKSISEYGRPHAISCTAVFGSNGTFMFYFVNGVIAPRQVNTSLDMIAEIQYRKFLAENLAIDAEITEIERRATKAEKKLLKQ